MDSDLIYAKTASGEEAVQKRTRVMQRNVRMILILVDGQSSVADLCQKTGNSKLTESALAELEKSGLIELRIGQDSLWEESHKVAEEIRAAAISRTPPKASEVIEKPPVYQPEMIDDRLFVHSVFPVQARDPSNMRISLTPLGSTGDSFGLVPDPGSLSGMRPSAAPLTRGVASVLPATSGGRKVTREERGKPLSDDEVDIKPIRRGPRSPRNWGALAFSGLAGIFAILFLLAVFFPYTNYLPQVEAALSQTVGQPVKVGAMRVDFFANPGLQLGDVRFGSGDKAVRVAEIRLLPELGSLMSPKIVFRDAVVSGANVPLQFVSSLSKFFEFAASPGARFGVRRLTFEKTGVSLDGLTLPDLEGEASLAADGRLKRLSLHTQDRSLKLEMKPVNTGLDIAVEAYGWRPSPKASLAFDSIAIKARLENGALAIGSMDLRVFDGLIQGKSAIKTGERTAVVGDIRFERINMGKLGNSLGVGQQFAGDAFGNLHFTSAFDAWEKYISGLGADGDFIIRRGSIGGIDLTEAVRRVSGAPVQGGATQFEELSGKLKFTSGGWLFSGLVMNSGLMQSTGYLQIDRSLEASGRMELKIRGSVNQRQVPVSITGPLSSPMVKVIGC